MLDLIGVAADECVRVEAEFGRKPPPELETLVKLHRVLVLRLCNKEGLEPKDLESITRLMRPVMEFARLEELRRARELAEQKYRDQVAADQAAREQEQRTADGADTLRPQTITKIEHELHLF